MVGGNEGRVEQSGKGREPVLLEGGVSVAAWVARWAAEADMGVGLIANGAFPGHGRPIRIGVGQHPDRLNRILEALAPAKN